MIPEYCNHTGYNRFMSDQYDDIDKQVHRIIFHFECSQIFRDYRMVNLARHIRYIKGEFHKDHEWYAMLLLYVLTNAHAWGYVSSEKFSMLTEALKDYLC